MPPVDFKAQVEELVRAHLKKKADQFDQPIQELLHHFCVPGLSIAVVSNGEIAWTGCYGVCGDSQLNAITPTTRFQAASLSKPVTALATLRMAEAGLVDLDADVNERLKAWKVPPVADWQPRITLRMLLSHTAGLSTSGFMGYLTDQTIPSIPDILNSASGVNSGAIQPIMLPGLSFNYSGGGTTVVQLLLTEVTGQDFPTLMREWVLDPLEMHDSAYEQPPLMHDHHARGHYSDGTPIPGGWHIHPELAAAGLWTTPTDLALFVMTLQAAYRGEHAIISKSTAEAMFQPQALLGASGEQVTIGLVVAHENDQRQFFHGGSNVGFKCLFKGFVEKGEGFAIMTNGDQGFNLIEAFEKAIAQIHCWSAPEEKPVLKSDLSLVGIYRLKDITLELTAQEEELWLAIGNQPALPLHPSAPQQYTVGTLETSLKVKDDGVTLEVQQAGQTLTATKIDI